MAYVLAGNSVKQQEARQSYGNALRTGVEFPVKKYSTRLKIITRAGLKPWPKLFQNMRATRQTELSGQFPLHVVCDWLGNSAPIAQKDYLRVTEQDFAAAISGGAKRGALFDETLSSDPILSELITLWPQLAASLREALLQQATQSLTRGP